MRPREYSGPIQAKACDYWAKKVDPNGKLHVSAYEIHLVMIYNFRLQLAIEKLVVFHCHVSTLSRFASSKRMRSPFFSSDVIIISAEKKRPTLLRWPSDEQEWLNSLKIIYKKHELESEDGQKVVVRAVGYGVAAKVHCKCAIVAQLYQYVAFLVFSYVGLSSFLARLAITGSNLSTKLWAQNSV